MIKKTLLVLASLLASTGAAQAQVAPAGTVVIPAPMRVMLGFSAVEGGDELVTALRTDGKSDNVKAGRGVTFFGGVDYRVSPQFSMLGTIGYQFDRVSADNGELKFTRIPLELLGFYHVSENWRIGGGLRYLSNATLSGSGVASMPDVDFKKTVSGVIAAEYMMGRNLGFQVRYVHETLKVDGYSGEVNADQYGAGVHWYF